MNTRAIYDVIDGTNNEQLKDLVDKELRTSITVVLTKGDSQGMLSDPQIKQLLKKLKLESNGSGGIMKAPLESGG
jgi:hypothetical protein